MIGIGVAQVRVLRREDQPPGARAADRTSANWNWTTVRPDGTELPDPSAAPHPQRLDDRLQWALGDYPALAAQVIPDLGARLVTARTKQHP